jgi:ADP-ribosylglycohydrolase
MALVLERIRLEIASKRPTYVHCWGGIGRTGMVVGCWLVEQGRTPAAALAEIGRLRATVTDAFARSPETDQQCEFVRMWRSTATRDPAASAAELSVADAHSGMRHCHTPAHFRGCLLGGAVGDALGAPVEFSSISEIRQRYGPQGIADYDIAYGRRGAITDDTQMTLFTAEGLLRAHVRWHFKGICHTAAVVHHAYVRWLHTQGERSRSPFSTDKMDGWLIDIRELHECRAPGNTCLSALREPAMGTIERSLNNSKGCGGVMRVAPIGLLAGDEEAAFALGCEAAAITHGHPSGYYSAGCLAAIIRYLVEGRALPDAIESALEILERSANARHQECSTAVRRAVALWRDARVAPTPEAIAGLGGGWVGEEALAIALYCALHAENDFARGVLLAVNHSGDSDSTGAIAGNLLGLIVGIDRVPERWLDTLELRETIEAMANDLYIIFDDARAWSERYPGW